MWICFFQRFEPQRYFLDQRRHDGCIWGLGIVNKTQPRTQSDQVHWKESIWRARNIRVTVSQQQQQQQQHWATLIEFHTSLTHIPHTHPHTPPHPLITHFTHCWPTPTLHTNQICCNKSICRARNIWTAATRNLNATSFEFHPPLTHSTDTPPYKVRCGDVCVRDCTYT